MSQQRLILPEGLHAPAQARAWLAARLAELFAEADDSGGAGPFDGVVQDALLVVSELVTNAIRHGRPVVEVGLQLDGGRVRLEVRDGGEQLPTVPSDRPSIDRSTGRGLLIVAATARDWGVVRGSGAVGKTVWAELAVDDVPTSRRGRGDDAEKS